MVSAEDTARGAAYPGWGTSLLLLVSLGFVVAGIFEPAIHVQSLYFWSQEHSIYSGTMTFFDQDKVLLGSGLFLVSIAFPVVKIVLALLTVASFTPGHAFTNGLLSVLAMLSRWSMTDVFILAVVVLVLDGRVITTANLLDGAYYFAIGVLLSTGIVYSLLIRARRLSNSASEDQPAEPA